MKKRKKFLILYFSIIIILLIIIIIIPDRFFTKKYDKLDISNQTETKKFTDYEEQKKHLLNNNYNYEYLLLDSMGTETYNFSCTGQIKNEIESGSCTSPQEVSYTEKTKKEVFPELTLKYLNVEKIFSLIEDSEPEEIKYTSTREYIYKVEIEDLDTDITITTDLDEITKICLSNAYMTYILKYSNVNY